MAADPAVFAATWAVVERDLRRYLRRRGVRGDVDDLVQETAVRLLTVWAGVHTESSVVPLARTIALNAWRDAMKSPAAHVVVVGAVPESPAPDGDVERIVGARAELDCVLRSISALAPADRRVVEVAAARALGGAAGTMTAADRMRLMRCRRDLAAVVAPNVA